jgi:hypothetical protein
MSISRKHALDYAEELISVPRSRVMVTLCQWKEGVTLLHNHRALTKCYVNRSGMRAAVFMAMALGVKIPPLGSSVKAKVSTGVLWRAISISCLNFRKKESYILLERLLDEAAMMRDSAIEGM